ncbi:hypothetical protein ACFL27_28585, partial [candidate division CSSED10-310 bacterium]
SVEDAEFGSRLNQAGVAIQCLPGWEIDHLHEYSLSDLAVTALRRAAAIVRLKLRKKGQQPGQSRTSPLGYRLSLLVLILCLLCLGGAFYLHTILLTTLAGIFLYLIYYLNLPLLKAMRKSPDNKAVLFFLFYLPLDLFFHNCGIIWGIISYYRGKTY